MPTVQFIGRVVPQGAKISINLSFGISWTDVNGVSVAIRPKIENSAIVVGCDISRIEPHNNEFMGDLFSKVLSQTQAAVDLFAFSIGHGLTVSLEQFRDEIGNISDLLFSHPDLPALCTAYKIDREFAEVLRDTVSEPLLAMAIGHLVRTQAAPYYALVGCGRALDGIRHVIVGPDIEAKKGWPIVRNALNVDETYTQLISRESIKPRHGERLHGENENINEVVRRCWVLMNRLLEYRKRNQAPLRDPEFPLLTG
jgi:hypothetical protein